MMDRNWYVVKHRGTLPGWQIWEGHPMPSVSSPEDEEFVGYFESHDLADRVASMHNAALSPSSSSSQEEETR